GIGGQQAVARYHAFQTADNILLGIHILNNGFKYQAAAVVGCQIFDKMDAFHYVIDLLLRHALFFNLALQDSPQCMFGFSQLVGIGIVEIYLVLTAGGYLGDTLSHSPGAHHADSSFIHFIMNIGSYLFVEGYAKPIFLLISVFSLNKILEWATILWF